MLLAGPDLRQKLDFASQKRGRMAVTSVWSLGCLQLEPKSTPTGGTLTERLRPPIKKPKTSCYLYEVVMEEKKGTEFWSSKKAPPSAKMSHAARCPAGFFKKIMLKTPMHQFLSERAPVIGGSAINSAALSISSRSSGSVVRWASSWSALAASGLSSCLNASTA